MALQLWSSFVAHTATSHPGRWLLTTLPSFPSRNLQKGLPSPPPSSLFYLHYACYVKCFLHLGREEEEEKEEEEMEEEEEEEEEEKEKEEEAKKVKSFIPPFLLQLCFPSLKKNLDSCMHGFVINCQLSGRRFSSFLFFSCLHEKFVTLKNKKSILSKL